MSLMRIDDLFHFEKGILQSSKCTEGEFDFITASSEWKTHNEYTHDCEALVFAAAASGSLGRTHYVNGKFISSDLCFIITAKDPIKLPIDLKFYHMIFNEFKNDIVNSTKAGTSKEAIGMKAFGNYKLPYFAINKQIDTKVQFVNMQDSKVEFNVELTHQLDLIKQLRQVFLREAMQGKLVKNTITEETGQQLLAKIKAEKAQLIAEKKLKKEKELAPISEDEIPFEIPEHWAWCRLGEISNIQRGSSPRPKGDSRYFAKSQTSFNWITISDISSFCEGNKLKQTKEHLTEEGSKHSRFVDENEFIIAVSGSTTGKCCLTGIDGYIYDGLAVVKQINKNLPSEFLMNYMTYLYAHINNSKSGASFPNINTDFLNNLIYPLPPLHEQDQIVAKLEELMAFCDGLEQSIKESQGYNEMLLQQVLREALQVNTIINE